MTKKTGTPSFRAVTHVDLGCSVKVVREADLLIQGWCFGVDRLRLGARLSVSLLLHGLVWFGGVR